MCACRCVCGVYVCEVVDILGTWKHKVRKVQGHFWSLLELRGQPGLPGTVSTEKKNKKKSNNQKQNSLNYVILEEQLRILQMAYRA